jgi:hypothetical protein
MRRRTQSHSFGDDVQDEFLISIFGCKFQSARAGQLSFTANYGINVAGGFVRTEELNDQSSNRFDLALQNERMPSGEN